MKKIKITDSEARLLFFLLALLMLAGSYFLVFNKCMTAADEIEAENETNRATVQQLESMVSRQDEVEAETKACNELVEEIKAKYPPMVTTEKAIAIVQDVEDITEMHVTDITFTMDNLIGDISQYGTAAASAAEGEDTEADTALVTSAGSVGYFCALSMNYTADYDSFKEMAEYIGSLNDRMTIPQITAAYDSETGDVSGNFTVNMYYLTGTDRTYEAPKVEEFKSGVDNIFLSGGSGSTNSTSSDSTSGTSTGNTASESEGAADSE